MPTYPNRPKALTVETTNRCNLSCPMCLREEMTYMQGLMPVDLYERIVREAAQLGIPKLRFHWRGEPMLHPSWFGMIKTAKEVGIDNVTLITNGTVLGANNRAQLLESKLDEIQISLDAVTQRTFERLRIGARYDQVMTNVHALLREKEDHPGDLRVVLRFTVLAENECELDDFINYWKGRVDDIIVAEDTRPGMPPLRLQLQRVPNRICHDLSTELFVSWDGRVFPCFVSYNGELLLGDLKKESLNQIWSGGKLARLRRLHESGQRGQISLCSTCTSDQCLILSVRKGEIRRTGIPND